MLATEPMTGYRLREAIAESVGHFWRESYGQLYPALREIEQQGLVVADRVPGDGRRQVQYRITDAGRAELRAWLAEEPESVTSTRSELLLKVFFGRHADPGVIRGHLERHSAALRAAAEGYRMLRRELEAETGADRRYWLATVMHGLTMVEAGATWADQAMMQLAEADPVSGELPGE